MGGAAPANIGSVTTPQPNAGNATAAMNDIRNALRMLEKALPAIPFDSDMHKEVLQTITKLSKNMNPGDGNEALELQSLLQMGRQMSQSAPMSALARMQAPAGGPPAMPGQPPQQSPEPPMAAAA